MNRSVKKIKKGFTLTELIVVIVIIGILAAILIPTLTGYIKKAKYSNDVQNTETLNSYLDNNSILFPDFEIESRQDVIDLLKMEDPDKKLDLTLESDGYYLWYDIKNEEIILETYDKMEDKASGSLANVNKLKQKGKCISEFFEGYYFLSEGGSSLVKVINIVESLNLKDNYSTEAKELEKYLKSVKKDGFELAYKNILEFFESPIEFEDSKSIIRIIINGEEVTIIAEIAKEVESIEITTMPTKLVYKSGDVLDLDGIVVDGNFKGDIKETIDNSLIKTNLPNNIVNYANGGNVIIEISYTDPYGTTVTTSFEVTVEKIETTITFDDIYYLTYTGASLNSQIIEILTSQFSSNKYDYFIDEEIINAGVYEVTVKAISKVPNYADTEATVKVTVKGKEITITPDSLSVNIGDKLPDPSELAFSTTSELGIGDTLDSILNNLTLTINDEGYQSAVGSGEKDVTINIEWKENANKNYIIKMNPLKFAVTDNNLKFIPLFRISGEDITFDSNKTFKYTYDPNKIWSFGGKFVDTNENEVTDATVKLTADFMAYPEKELGVNGISGFSDAGEYIIHVNLYETNKDYRFEEEVYTIIVEKAQATADMVVIEDYTYAKNSNGNFYDPIFNINESYKDYITKDNLEVKFAPIDPTDENNRDKSTAYFEVVSGNYTGTFEKEFNVIYQNVVIEYYDSEDHSNENLLYSEVFYLFYLDEPLPSIITLDEANSITQLKKDHYVIDSLLEDNYDFGQTLDFGWSLVLGTIELSVLYTPIEYTITYNLDGGQLLNNTSNPEKYTIESGEILLNEPKKLGYTFVGWSDGVTTYTSTIIIDDSFECGNKEYVAIYEASKYDLKYYVDGNEHDTQTGNTFNESFDLIANPIKEGYTFDGWYIDPECTELYQKPEKWNSTDNPTKLYGKFTINTYTISFEENEGSLVDDIVAEYQATVTKPINPTKDGYTFGGWYENQDFSGEEYQFSTMPSKDIKLYAKWDAEEYEIIFESNGGSNVATISQPYGSDVETPGTPTKDGYNFIGWYDNEELSGEAYVFTTMPLYGIKLYAKWDLIIYNIDYKYLLGDGSEINIDVDVNDNPTTYNVTSSFNLNIVKLSGYTFDGWFLDNKFIQGVNSIEIGTEGDLTIYAKFHNQAVKNVELLNNPSKMNYVSFDKFDLFGSRFKITYDNGSTEIVNGEKQTIVYVDGRDYLLANDQYITVIIFEKEIAISGITVEKKIIDVIVNNYEITYGDDYDLTNVEFNYSYNYNNENLNDYLRVSINEVGILDVGEYDIIVDSNNHAQYDFNIINTGKLIVKQKSIENYEFSSIDEQFVDYNISDNPCEPKISLPSGLSDEDVEIAYRDNNKLGNAVLVITGKGNYTGFKEITFKISAKEYSIFYDYNDGLLGEFSNPTSYVWTAGEIKLNNPTKDGYTFTGWTVNEEEVGIVYTINNITCDLVITASWKINQYTITFITDGGSTIDPITQDYNTDVIAPNNPTKIGYTFDGWDKEIPSTMPAENVTITAIWAVNEYTITFDTDGGTEIPSITQAYNTAITKPANPTKTGYKFVDWNKVIPTTMPAENVTITAIWAVNEYTITFDTDGGTKIAPITQEYNTAIIKPANPTKTGYTFAGWDVTIPITMPAEDIIITAIWTVNQYTITFNTDGGNDIEPITQDYGTIVKIPINPVKEGYKFDGWDNEVPTTMPAENITIKVKWIKLSYFAGQKPTCIKSGIIEYWFDEESMYTDCYGLTTISNVIIPIDANAHSFDDENDKICNLCYFDRTVFYKVTFKNIDGSDFYTETVLENECISESGLLFINNYVTPISYSKFYIFKGWYEENDSSKQYVTDSYVVEKDVVFILDVEEIDRIYTTNINYIDKDGQRNYTIIYTDILEVKYSDDINTNIRVQDGSLYLLYMSSCDLFNKDHWNKLINGTTDEQNGYLRDSNNNLNYIAKISIDETNSSGVLNILVLCEQPAAVITSTSSVNWPAEGATKTSFDTDFTIFGDYYYDVTSAINSASNTAGEQYIFIYGQGKNNKATHSFLPDATNTIKSKTITIENISYTITQYVLDMSRYQLANDNIYTITDNIVLPYLRSYTNSTGKSPIGCLNETTASNGTYTQSYLIIPEDVTIYLEGNIYVGGVAYSAGQNSSGIIGSRSVIMNNGDIIARSGSEIISYGYIRGENGFIELENGSQLIDVFRIYDYAGGTYSASMYLSSIFPMQVYSFHNVSCDIKINYGSNYLAYASIYASSQFQTSKNITIVGSKGLFELTENSAYVYKKVVDTVNKTNLQTSYTETSQNKTHREVLDMYGSFKDNSISVNFAGMDIKTSTNMIMPIGMMSINIQSGNSTLSACSYKFLPGSRVHIMKGATLTISEKVSVAFYGDDFKDYFENVTSYAYQNQQKDWYSKSDKIGSILTVDGTLYVNGSIGGEINSSGTGIIKIKNNLTEVKLVKKLGTSAISSAETITQKIYAIGNINLKPLEVFEINKNYYYTDGGYWTTLGTHSITFDSNGGSSISPITFNTRYENGKVLADLDNNISLVPTRSYYEFMGWYLEDSYLTKVDFSKIYGDVTLYAKWEGYKYNISYNIDSGVIMPEIYNAIHTYGVNTTLPIPTKDGYKFAGWYLTSGLDDEGARIEYLSGTQFTDDINLYPCWKSEDYIEYEIKFEDSAVTENNFVKYLPDDAGDGELLGSFANNPSNPFSFVFDGWYDSNGVKFTSDSFVNSDIVLRAKWMCKVTYSYDNTTMEDYVEYGTAATRPTDPTKNKYTFSGWFTDSACTNTYNFDTIVNSNITLYGQFTSSGGGCFASGTLITLYDGTIKKIEDITLDDILMVFDHEKGVYTSAPIIFIENDGMDYYNVITLEFANGTTTRIIYEHALFNLTLNKYVYITENNYNEFIGHSFAVYDDELKSYNSTILVKSSIVNEYTGCYSLVTAYHMNNFIDGLFSMPGGITGLFNYFEYDESLKYEENNMKNDIDEYGLYTYDDFKDYIPYEVFEYMFPAKYFKVAVGKEMISFEGIVLLIEKYLVGHEII